MEISMTAGFLPANEKEEEAVLGDPSSMFPESQFASTFVIAEDAPLPNVVRSCEEISATQEAIPVQESPIGTEALARSCASPSNSNAEVMDVACNPLMNPHHIDEIESSDAQPFNAQETHKHEGFLPVDGWHALSLCAEQMPSTQNCLDPTSSAEPAIGNLLPSSAKPTGELCSVLAEEGPRDNGGMDCSVSEGLAPTCESMVVDESIISHANVMGTEPTNAIDTMLIEAMNDSTNGESEKQVCGARASADTVSIIGHSALQQEGNSPAMTVYGTGLHESASIEASQEIVTDSGLKQPEVVTSIQKEDAEMVVDPSETVAAQDIRVGDLGDNEISEGSAVVDAEMKQAGSLSTCHDSHLTYSKDTLVSAMKREVDEREVAVGVAIQHIKDGVVNEASQSVGIDEGMKHFESSNPPILLDPAEGRGVGALQEADVEMKTARAVGSDSGQLQEAELNRETEWEKTSNTISITGASEILKAEEETKSLKAQSEEIDKDEQDPHLPSQNSEGGLELEHSELNKDSEMLPADDVLPEQQQQPRKRGRKPGKKVAKKAEKDASIGLLQESEPDKETEDSPSKVPVDSPSKVPVENEMKRELRKRGRKSGTTKVTQKEEEDVCFVCFDGGNLILCDKRSCPKAYHVECTGRESEFFEKKGQWFCGWHVCSQCSRSARLNCYMCPSALCSTCMKGANFLCIRKSRGLCEGCYPLVYMIEHNKTINGDPIQVDFNDKETYEGLFKEYWEELKLKLSLTPTELDKAWKAKEAGGVLAEGGTNNGGEEEIMGDDDGGSTDSEDRPPTIRHARLMKRKRLTRHSVAEDASASEFEEDESDGGEIKLESTPKKGRTRAPEFDGWASKELADIIQSLKEDPKKKLPLFGVKKLLWRYIDENKLTDPRRRGQIVCDERLKKLFGKKHVGRFEMMKLIGLHVASPNKSTPSKGRELPHGEIDAVELDDSDENQLGKKKPRRKSDDKRFRPDPSEYAAVNVKNINMIYLKRSVLDELRNDPELESKAVGAFVRIRVPGTVNKNDACYRLVQVVGVKQIYDAHDPEKVTDVILEILNLHKREEVTADLVSNQDLVEEECRRLRQSVRCGFIKAMRVGELEERARALREAKVKDWREFELLRLSHLRDRASEKGRKKELRECVEKLQLLSTPEEKERQLKAPFDIDADPYMDPDYESDEEELPADDGGQGEISAPQSMPEKVYPTRFPEKGNSTGSAERQYSHRDSGSVLEPHRNPQDTQLKTFAWGPRDSGDNVKKAVEIQAQGLNPSPRTQRDKNAFTGQGKGGWGDGAGFWDQFTGRNQGSFGRKEVRWTGNTGGSVQSSGGWRKTDSFDAVARFPVSQGEVSAELASGHTFSPIHTPVTSGTLAGAPAGAFAGAPAGALVGAPSGALAGAPAVSMNITATMVPDNEKEKLWCYQDPTRTVQGPFAVEQLRKWEKTNLFPLDLRIWRVTESQDASMLLSEVLAGRFTSRGPLSLPQKSNPSNLPLGPMQGTHVNGIPVPPVQGLSANNFSMGSTVGPNGSSFSSGSAQGILANPMPPPQRPNIQSFPMSPIQGLNAHGFVSGPIQGPGAHALSSGPVHAPSGHVFHPIPTQGSNAHNFAPVPTQGPYVNNFSAALSQGTNFNAPLPGPMQGPNVTGYPPNLTQGLNVLPGQAHAPMAPPGQPQGPNVLPGQMQAPMLLPGQTQAPNVLAGHIQGPHFNNVQAQGPHVNNFPMGSTPGPVNNNLSQMGQVISNSGREFRNASMPNRPTSDWQDTGRRSGPEQHFGGPASQTVEGNAWGGSRRIEHPASDVGSKVIQTRSPWRNQGPGAPRHDSRDTHNRGHFGRGQNFRGSDHYQGSDGRFTPKKELFCKYFQRGLCKKGQACDFRH